MSQPGPPSVCTQGCCTHSVPRQTSPHHVVTLWETQTFVIHVGGLCDQSTFELLGDDDQKRALLRVGGGASQIIDPTGMTIAGPLGDDEEAVLVADCDMATEIPAAKLANGPGRPLCTGRRDSIVAQ